MTTPFFELQIQGHTVRLEPQNLLDGQLVFPDRPQGNPLGRVQSHPKHPEVLGLQNLTVQSWQSLTPEGQKHEVAAGKTIKLTEGTQIDFGGVMGVILLVTQASAEAGKGSASVPTVPPPLPVPVAATVPAPKPREMVPVVSIEKGAFEQLCQTLAMLGQRGLADGEVFQKLHRKLLVTDDQNRIWTYGLRTQQWHRSNGKQWLAEAPPPQFTIAVPVLDELKALKLPAKT